MDRGLVGVTNSQLKMLMDLPSVNFFSLDQVYRYTFFTSAHARSMRELWGVDVAVGMDALGEVIQDNHDRTKANNSFYWALSGNDFTVTEAFGLPSSRRLFASRYSPTRDEQGKIVGVTVLMSDATERIQLANEQRALDQKLLEASHLTSLGLMVGCVSHDFNNILLTVLLSSELALKSIEPIHPTAELLAEVIASVGCAGELTKQLLSFGGTGGTGSVGKELVELNAIVESVAELSRAAVGRRAELVKSLDTIPLPIKANPTQLRQVIINLLTNASEATRGERLQISIKTSAICVADSVQTKWVYPSNIPTGQYAVITIQDNGCGMSDEQLNRIFQPFFSTKGTGRGLGLTAVQGIVNNHSGFLAIDSTPGVGSTFRIGFPIAQVAAQSCFKEESQEFEHEIIPFQPLRLLIVDDNPSSLKAISSVCSKLGHSVAIASNELDAGAAIVAGQFDLVLLDAEMAGGCSERILDSIPICIQTPVVLMTGEIQPETLITNSRVHRGLMKPFSIGALVSTFQRIPRQSPRQGSRAAFTR